MPYKKIGLLVVLAMVMSIIVVTIGRTQEHHAGTNKEGQSYLLWTRSDPTPTATPTTTPTPTITPTPTPTDLYVATTGSDSNTCTTSGAPCQTITGAIGKAMNGSHIHINAGTYPENVTIAGINNVTLCGEGSELVKVTIQPTTGDGVTVIATGVTLQNLTVTTTGTDIGVRVSSGGTASLTDVRASGGFYGLYVQNSGSSATVAGGSLSGTGFGVGALNGGTVSLTNVIISGYNSGLVVIDTVSSGSTTATVSGGSITGTTGSGIYVSAGGAMIPNIFNATITGATYAIECSGTESVSTLLPHTNVCTGGSGQTSGCNFVPNATDMCEMFAEMLPGPYHDAEKHVPNQGDGSQMCWAAASANMLMWDGWATGFTSAQDIFAYYQARWDNEGGPSSKTQEALHWWFSGDSVVTASYLNPDGGTGFTGYWPDETFSTYFYQENAWGNPDALNHIASKIQEGSPVIISMDGHWINVWGYDYDANNTCRALWITDNEDGDAFGELRRISFAWDTLYGGHWHSPDYTYMGMTNFWDLMYMMALEKTPYCQEQYPFTARCAEGEGNMYSYNWTGSEIVEYYDTGIAVPEGFISFWGPGDVGNISVIWKSSELSTQSCNNNASINYYDSTTCIPGQSYQMVLEVYPTTDCTCP